MKTVAGIIVLLISIQCYAGTLSKNELVQLIVNAEIVGRDSGQNVTDDFVQGCIKRGSQEGYRLECEDVLFSHYMYQFEKSDSGVTAILIVEDGASVENRWVYEAQEGQYRDITERAWPDITDEEISTRLQCATGQTKYTPDYVRQVAHSSYRVERAEGDKLVMRSGIPDESHGEWLGEIQWTGERFMLVPNESP